MALKVMEKDIAETEDIPIVVVTSTDIVSNIKGYHVYKSVWTPTLQEQVYGEIEPHNPVDKYAVAVKKDENVVGHLPLGVMMIHDVYDTLHTRSQPKAAQVVVAIRQPYLIRDYYIIQDSHWLVLPCLTSSKIRNT